MRFNKQILMIATTAMVALGSIGLMAAMKQENVKTEASDIKENDVAKAGVDVSSASMEGETPSEGERKMKKEVVEKYSYKGYEITFIRYKDAKTGEYLSDVEQAGDYGYKKTFRDVIDKAENSGWNYMLEELKGKKDKITAKIEWKRDYSKIVNNKFYGKLMRQCRIIFKIPNISDNKKYIQIETMGSSTTVAESGEYIGSSRSDSIELQEYPSQWGKAYERKIKEVERKFKKYKKISNNKKSIKKYAEKVKGKILKELKEVYGINVVKEIRDDYYEKYNLAENDMNNGIVTLIGQTDDGQDIEASFDLAGEYISYWSYKH